MGNDESSCETDSPNVGNCVGSRIGGVCDECCFLGLITGDIDCVTGPETVPDDVPTNGEEIEPPGSIEVLRLLFVA